MVKIRLTRMGKKKQPFYRIVAVNSRVKRDGKYNELIGTYNPLVSADSTSQTTKRVNINHEIALKWLMSGAQPTDRVKSLFVKENIMNEFKELRAASKKEVLASKEVKKAKISSKTKKVENKEIS